MTRTEIKMKIDNGAQQLLEVAKALGCPRERDMIHDAVVRLFFASCGKRSDDDYTCNGTGTAPF